MKKQVYLFLVIISFTLFSCEDYKDIELVEMKNVEVKNLTMQGVYLNLSAVLNNPNNLKFTVADTDLELTVNNTNLGVVKLVNAVKIDKNCTKQYDVKLFCKFENISLATIPVLVNTFSGKSANIKIKGYVKARKFLFAKKFPVEITDKVSF
jgi:LEA14-like dessication related protein